MTSQLRQSASEKGSRILTDPGESPHPRRP